MCPQWFELLVSNMRKNSSRGRLVVKYGGCRNGFWISLYIFIFFLNATDAKINPRQYLSPRQALEPANYFLGRETRSKRASHRLNMELDLQSFLGLHVKIVHSCTHWLRPRDPRPHLGSYTRSLLAAKTDDISL
jgi:hypothetical protein